MNHHHISLSKWALAKECSYWGRSDVELPRDEPGKPARVGTMVHRLADVYAKTGKVAEPLEKDDLTEFAEAKGIFEGPLRGWIDGWKLLPGEKHTELRLRYDARFDSVGVAPRRDQAGYTRPLPYEVTGELDFVRVAEGVVEVVDLKTGKFSDSAVAQLDAYSMLASRHFGVSAARHYVLYARKTKIVPTVWVEMDADALDAEAGAIVRVLRRLPTVQPTPPADSKACAFICPLGRAACPAHADRQSETSMPDAEFFGDSEVA